MSNQNRNQAVAAAIREGKILAASAGTYARRFDADPAGTERILASVAATPLIAEANRREIGEDVEGYVEVCTAAEAAGKQVPDADMGAMFPHRLGPGGPS